MSPCISFKNKLLGVTCTFGYGIKIYRYAETLAGTGVGPAPASNLKKHHVVSYREICDTGCIHEAIGFKVDIFNQLRIHLLIETYTYL